MISDEILMIDVQGSAIGRINALSVYSLGDYSFGKPNRISVSVAPGKGGILDIERLARLGGPTHTKGVMILAGYLNRRYAQQGPLNLSASLTFEQSYSEIDGDSASAAELLALLSAIAEVPIRQDLAVTGSINQHGQIQAVGGINEKIEGFFATCKAKGLTGTQGVIIPGINRHHLMLKPEIVAAVADGKFHIYPIAMVDEGAALLTGCEIGEMDPTGHYPQGTFNRMIQDRLELFANLARAAASDQAPSTDELLEEDHPEKPGAK